MDGGEGGGEGEVRVKVRLEVRQRVVLAACADLGARGARQGF